MVTIRDVARHACVSPTLVSVVLNSQLTKAPCAPETRQRVLSSARELGYRRNPHSFALRTGRTHVMGIYVADMGRFLSHPAGARQIAVIAQSLAGLGYSLTIYSTGQEREIDPRLMDGLIVADMKGGDAEAMSRLAAQMPVLAVDSARRVRGVIPADFLPLEHFRELHRTAARYLFGLGHRRIVITDVVKTPAPSRPVFEACAREVGLSVALTVVADDWAARVYPNLRQALAKDPLPTALYAFDDDLAQRAINFLSCRGKAVPGDVSVFSRETHASAIADSVGITGIAAEIEDCWRSAVPQFVEIIEGKRAPAGGIAVLMPERKVIERLSCGPAPA